MTPDNTTVDLDELSKEELKQQVRQLRFELRGEEHLTKRDILSQPREFDELGLEDDDLMDVEQKYNIGLRKSGWMKIYNYVKQQTRST